MDKQSHGRRLASAIGERGLSRQAVADATNRQVRTVTNWTMGETMPSEQERAALRRLLGPYDLEGDKVELAIRNSELTEDRQHAVLAAYHRQLREQREERSA